MINTLFCQKVWGDGLELKKAKGAVTFGKTEKDQIINKKSQIKPKLVNETVNG